MAILKTQAAKRKLAKEKKRVKRKAKRRIREVFEETGIETYCPI